MKNRRNVRLKGRIAGEKWRKKESGREENMKYNKINDYWLLWNNFSLINLIILIAASYELNEKKLHIKFNDSHLGLT